MDTTTSSTATNMSVDKARPRRGGLLYVKRGLKWLGIGLLALVLLGVAYQIIATEIDN